MTRAAALALLFVTACALSHELTSHDHPDAGRDASLVLDLGSTTLDAGTDSGDARSCNERWATLPYCPADTASAIGRTCPTEGQLCGGCCVPGPDVMCRGGVWTETMTTCPMGILCPAIPSCGTGSCPPGEVCLHLAGDFFQPDRCVVPPFPPTMCDAVPAGWLTSDPRSCSTCSCADRSFPISTQLEVTLDCPCCDVAIER